jgi:hypothetical protein
LRAFAITAALITSAFALPAMAGEVAGTVYDQRGIPAAGVTLELGDARAVSGADGSYSFTDIAAGEHMIAAGSQRIAVAVPGEGATRRNIFLLSRSARTAITGEVLDSPALDRTIQLAETMLRESDRLGESAWRWNDLEG